MKIGFDAKRAFLNKAGLGNYSRNTLVSLQKYYPENQYLLFTPDYRTDLFKEYMFFDVEYPGKIAKSLFKPLWRTWWLSHKVKKYNLDLFHGLSNELPGGIHLSGIPAVVTIHDLIFINFPGLYKAIDRKIYYEKVKYASGAAKRIIATSKQTRNDLIYHLGLDPEKIEVIYQSIAERFFLNHITEDTEDVIQRYKLPSEYILTVGTIEPRKNQLGVLRALESGHIDVPYVMVGKPTPYTRQIELYAAERGLKEKVFILNDVPDFDMPALYQKALAMVYLSHYEGFGLPVIESMACGCPVITSSVSCLPEIGGDAALYCNPDDQECVANTILKVIGNSSLVTEMAEKGRIRAQMFHPGGRVDSLMAFYHKVLENG